MKKLILVLGLALSVHSYAQQNKIDAQLKMWVNNPQLLVKEQPGLFKNGPVNDVMISLIFKTSSANAESLVKKSGGRLYSALGSIYTAEIPLKQILAFAAQPEISKIESSQPVEVYNDKGMQLIKADSVHNGFLPDQVKYSGKDVLVGIVDTGIDFLHPDFMQKNDSTKTRITAIWDQTAVSGIPPAGYTYGAAWNAAQIQAALSDPSLVSERDYSGHGTHVTGTSAGLRGLAYDAGIISVKTPLVSNGDYKFSTSAKTLDAVKFIYDKAVERQQACVVNMSLGFNFGAPHDGTSLFEQGLDYLMQSRWGFVVCASAGNEGRDFSHHGDYQVTNDSVWTYINSLNGCTWYGVNHSSQDDSLYISVSMDSAAASFSGSGITYQKPVFQSAWMNINAIRSSLQPISYPILYGNGDTASVLTISASSYDSARTEWYVYTRDNNLVSTTAGKTTVNLFKIAFKGSGKFHAWIQALNGLGTNLATFNAATNARFKPSDNKYVIGIPGTGKNVLTVGAFINKQNYVDLYGVTQPGLNTSNAKTGGLAFFSSNGPTTDGRIKPDITAPGLNVASSKSHDSEMDSSRMTDLNTIVFSGTSMSCPMTTGAVALLLQKYRFADYAEVKTALTSTAVKDNFVSGTLPNNIWGYGKLNIFAAMKLPVTGMNEMAPGNKNGVIVYPNPSATTITFKVEENINDGNLSVIDITGKSCYESSDLLKPVDVSSWSKGLYFYIISGTNRSANGKFIVK
ncbi:MAG: S8 family peptidase [Bacteroidota bacterium]